jgi:hypothetical protein
MGKRFRGSRAGRTIMAKKPIPAPAKTDSAKPTADGEILRQPAEVK